MALLELILLLSLAFRIAHLKLFRVIFCCCLGSKMEAVDNVEVHYENDTVFSSTGNNRDEAGTYQAVASVIPAPSGLYTSLN